MMVRTRFFSSRRSLLARLSISSAMFDQSRSASFDSAPAARRRNSSAWLLAQQHEVSVVIAHAASAASAVFTPTWLIRTPAAFISASVVRNPSPWRGALASSSAPIAARDPAPIPSRSPRRNLGRRTICLKRVVKAGARMRAMSASGSRRVESSFAHSRDVSWSIGLSLCSTTH
jgi:hypothetical protein